MLSLDRRARASRPRARRARERRPARPAAPPVRPMSTRRAIGRVLLGVGLLAVLAVPAMSMRLGLPDGSSESPSSTQYRAYTTVAEKFGAGVNGPLLVVADLPGSPTQDEVLADQVRIGRQLAAFTDVVAVAPIGTSADGSHDRLPGRPGRRADERLDGAARQGPPGGLAARRRRPDRASPARPAATSTSRRSWRTPCRSTSRSSSVCRC